MLFQQAIPTSLTFTVGWVDLFIIVILIVTFVRGRGAFKTMLIIVIAMYIIRIFPNQIIGIVQAINNLNGPAAFITISR